MPSQSSNTKKQRRDSMNLVERREELDQERRVIVDFINKIEIEKKNIFFNSIQ